ncbi:LysR family transcriptional regulator [Streptomyces sp. NPDC057806]|uniref:LysR family transcriptional regulator n=1 Tax=Streptomyces sp. NPDC057806 TaxID=3346255 RepID=UPI0036AA9ACF
MTANNQPEVPFQAKAPGSAEPSIHQLRLFLTLSEELHFGRTAERLFISQSALSQQIRDLEKRWQVRLFERTSRAVRLTTSGYALLLEARAAVEATDRLRSAADAQRRQLSGQLAVGSIGAEAAMPRTRAVLQALHNRHPRITVQLSSLNIADHMADLIQQKIDVMFLRPPVPDGIEVHHLATEPRVACLPVDAPLAASPQIALAQLSGYPVITFPPQTPKVWREFWAVDPRPDGSPVRYGPVVSDVEALLHAVASGQAMSFLPAAARDFFPRPGIRFVDVVGLSPSTSALAWLSRRRDEPAIAAIRQTASTTIREPTSA